MLSGSKWVATEMKFYWIVAAKTKFFVNENSIIYLYREWFSNPRDIDFIILNFVVVDINKKRELVWLCGEYFARKLSDLFGKI